MNIHFNFEENGGTESIHIEEVNRVRDGVLDDNPPCKPVNQLSDCGFDLIGNQEGWVVVSEVGNGNLP